MAAPPALEPVPGEPDQGLLVRVLGGGEGVQVPDGALRDHRLQLPVQRPLQALEQVHVECGRVDQRPAVGQDLVRFPEAEADGVLGHEFAVLLRALAPHRGGSVGWGRAEVVFSELVPS